MISFQDFVFLAELSHLQSRDLLVAVVAIGLGINIIYAVLVNHRRCYSLNSVKLLESNFGRRGAQIILFFVGGACLMMGAYLVAQATNHRKNSGSLETGSVFPLVSTQTNSQ